MKFGIVVIIPLTVLLLASCGAEALKVPGLRGPLRRDPINKRCRFVPQSNFSTNSIAPPTAATSQQECCNMCGWSYPLVCTAAVFDNEECTMYFLQGAPVAASSGSACILMGHDTPAPQPPRTPVPVTPSTPVPSGHHHQPYKCSFASQTNVSGTPIDRPIDVASEQECCNLCGATFDCKASVFDGYSTCTMYASPSYVGAASGSACIPIPHGHTPTPVQPPPPSTPVPTEDTCGRYGTCLRCTAPGGGHNHCGWCATSEDTGMCVGGNWSGPFEGQCSAAHWLYYEIQCPAPPSPPSPPNPPPPPAQSTLTQYLCPGPECSEGCSTGTTYLSGVCNTNCAGYPSCIGSCDFLGSTYRVFSDSYCGDLVRSQFVPLNTCIGGWSGQPEPYFYTVCNNDDALARNRTN